MADDEESTDDGLDDETPVRSLREARTERQAAAVLATAIRDEGGDLAEVVKTAEEPWGWSFYIQFDTGSPDDVAAIRKM